jgi:hypothetical protein
MKPQEDRYINKHQKKIDIKRNATLKELDEESLDDEEILKKLKLILKTITTSSFYYKTVLSKSTFETLVKLQNYENTLNCKLHNCLHKVNDINDYILKTIDKNEIKAIISQVNIPTSSYSIASNEQQDCSEKPSSYTIKSNPYCYANGSELRINNENNLAVSSNVSCTYGSSMQSSHSFNSSLSSCKTLETNLKAKKSLDYDDSNSLFNGMTRTNLSSKRNYSLFNFNSARRVTPVSTTKSLTSIGELGRSANLCQRLVIFLTFDVSFNKLCVCCCFFCEKMLLKVIDFFFYNC